MCVQYWFERSCVLCTQTCNPLYLIHASFDMRYCVITYKMHKKCSFVVDGSVEDLNVYVLFSLVIN